MLQLEAFGLFFSDGEEATSLEQNILEGEWYPLERDKEVWVYFLCFFWNKWKMVSDTVIFYMRCRQFYCKKTFSKLYVPCVRTSSFQSVVFHLTDFSLNYSNWKLNYSTAWTTWTIHSEQLQPELFEGAAKGNRKGSLLPIDFNSPRSI